MYDVKLIFVHQNSMSLREFKNYLNIFLENKIKYKNTLLLNPILSVNDTTVKIAHSSVENHLIVIFLSYYIMQGNINIDSPVYKIMARFCDGKAEELDEIKVRIENTPNYITKFQAFFKSTLKFLRDSCDDKKNF